MPKDILQVGPLLWGWIMPAIRQGGALLWGQLINGRGRTVGQSVQSWVHDLAGWFSRSLGGEIRDPVIKRLQLRWQIRRVEPPEHGMRALLFVDHHEIMEEVGLRRLELQIPETDLGDGTIQTVISNLMATI
jgi:hypothetical protein